MWIAGSILVLAAVLYAGLRRLTRTVGMFGHIIEKALNRAAETRGEPPITTREDIEMFK